MSKRKGLSPSQIKALQHADTGGISLDGKTQHGQLGVSGSAAQACLKSLKTKGYLDADLKITATGKTALAQGEEANKADAGDTAAAA